MRDRKDWSMEELFDLQKKVFPLLGWRGNSQLKISCEVSCDSYEMGDSFLFIDINKREIKEKDLKKVKRKLRKVIPKSLPFTIFWDDMPSKPFISIQLSKGELEK